MGRIITPVRVANTLEPDKEILFDAFVDTGSTTLVLPREWKSRLGELGSSRVRQFETADQRRIEGDICGPVVIEIEGFDPVNNEVTFIDMEPVDGRYEPLLGYIILEQSRVAVDMIGHRLVPVKCFDLK